MVIPIGGNDIKTHQTKGTFKVNMTSGQQGGDLEQVSIITARHTKIRQDQVAEDVDMVPPAAEKPFAGVSAEEPGMF